MTNHAKISTPDLKLMTTVNRCDQFKFPFMELCELRNTVTVTSQEKKIPSHSAPETGSILVFAKQVGSPGPMRSKSNA